MIIVELNLSVVGMLADRVHIMREGKIVQEFTEKADITDKTRLEQYV
jgi:ABC-type glutathione transport system ATPase component